MRIAVCSTDINERYELSKLLENALALRGVLPQMTLFSTLSDQIEASAKVPNCFDLSLVSDLRDIYALKVICNNSSVILLGKGDEGPLAFDVGADYLIKYPISIEELNKALAHCLP